MFVLGRYLAQRTVVSKDTDVAGHHGANMICKVALRRRPGEGPLALARGKPVSRMVQSMVVASEAGFLARSQTRVTYTRAIDGSA